jgi:hypothetical protein
MPSINMKFAYGDCHALTAALEQFRPAGEVLGLFVNGNLAHTVFRVPHTTLYADAHGIEDGAAGLAAKAIRYTRAGHDAFEWRRLEGARPFARQAAIRQAVPLAVTLLREADRRDATVAE